MVMDVIAAANARQAALPPGSPHVIRMEVGQPGTGAPAGAVAAARAALRGADPLGYTEAFGRPSLRARIAAHYQDWYGLALPPGRVAVTMGASGAFPLAFLAAFDPGDRVALAAPFYPPYVNILTALGLVPEIIETGPADRYQPTVAALERLDPRPAGLIVASPCNPAGTMLAPAELRAIAAWCDAHGVRLISDEIYHGLHYAAPDRDRGGVQRQRRGDQQFLEILQHDRLAGRLDGAAAGPAAAGGVPGAEHVHFGAACEPGGGGGGVRLHGGAGGERGGYRRSRDHLLAALPAAGFPDIAAADGAFYLYADVGRRTNDSQAFCARMLAEAGVAASPGVDFDRTRGHRTVRFSYCGRADDMIAAAARLAGWSS